MADRRVVVRLVGEVAQFQAAMGSAGTSTKAMAAQCQAAGIKMRTSMIGVGDAADNAQKRVDGSMNKMGDSLKRGMVLAAGMGAIGGVVAGAKMVMGFDVAMAKVDAVAGASTQQFARLRDMALEMGSKTKFSATQVAGGMEEMAKAGIATKDIFTALPSVLTLAAAGDLEVGRAASIAAITMTQFEKSAEDLPEIVDRLAKGAAASTADVDSLSTALAYVGPMAHAMGISMDETVNALSLFASAGLDADMAGTNMRGILSSMISPSKMATEAMEKYGIVLHDTQGNFLGFNNLSEQLSSKLGHLTDKERDFVLGKIVSNNQISGANILMREGAKGLDAWAAKVDAASSATEQASKKLNNLWSELKQLGGAIQSNVIRGVDNATPMLRSLTTSTTDAVRGFGELSGAMQATIVGLVLSRLAAGRFTSAMGSAGKGLGGFTTSLQITSRAQAEAATTAGNLLKATRGIGGLNAVPPSQIQALRQYADGARRAADQTQGMAGVIGRAHGSFITATGSAGRLSAGLRGLAGAARIGAGGLVSALGGPWGLALSAAVIGVGLLADAHGKAKAAEDLHKQSVQDLADALRESSGALTENVRAVALKKLQEEGLIDVARTLGISVRDMTDMYLGNEDALERVRAKLQTAKVDFIDMQKVAKNPWGADAAKQDAFFEAMNKLEDALPRVSTAAQDAKQKVQDYKDATGGAADATKGAGGAAKDATGAIAGVGEAGEGAAAGLDGMGKAAESTKDMMDKLRDSVDAIFTSLNAVSDAKSKFFSGDDKGKNPFEDEESVPGVDKKRRVAIADPRKPKTTTTVSGNKTTTTTVTPTRTGSITRTRVVTRTPGKETAGGITFDKDGTAIIAPGGRGPGKETVKETTKVTRGGVPKLWKMETIPGSGKDSKRTLKIKPVIDWTTGRFDVTSEKGRAQNDWMATRARDAASVWEEVYADAMVGVDAKDVEGRRAAAVIATAEFSRLRDTMIDGLVSMTGMSRKAAETVVNAYLPLPKVLAGLNGEKGLEKLVEDAKKAGMVLTELDGTQVGIDVNSEAAADKLVKLGGKLKRLPNGKFRVVFANATAATKAITHVVRPRSVAVKPVLSASDRNEFEEIRKRLGRPVRVPVKFVTDFDPSVQRLYDVLNDPKTKMPHQARQAHKRKLEAEYGGQLKKRALGGIESHVAGGPNMLYGERQTGMEAYIPKTGSRDVGMATLATAASWYGQTMQPASSPHVNVQARVFVGDREITDMIRVEVDSHGQNIARQSAYGRRA